MGVRYKEVVLYWMSMFGRSVDGQEDMSSVSEQNLDRQNGASDTMLYGGGVGNASRRLGPQSAPGVATRLIAQGALESVLDGLGDEVSSSVLINVS